MAGLFKIHPDGASTITTSTLDDRSQSSKFLFFDADLKERDREKILYSKGQIGGSVIGKEIGTTTVDLIFQIAGTSPEERGESVSELQTAFSNIGGGYFEYRPHEYSSSVLTTFYKYLRSGPPEMMYMGGPVQGIEEGDFGSIYTFSVEIWAVATSDPDSLYSLVSNVDVNNFTPNGYKTILNSSIKGDGLVPIINIGGGVDLDFTDELILHIMPIDAVALGDDFYDTTSGLLNFTYDATTRYRLNGFSTGYMDFSIPDTSRKLYGRVVPIIPCKVVTGDWEMRLLADYGYVDLITISDWSDVLTTDPATFDFNILETISYPPTPIPSTLTLTRLGLQSIRVEFRTKDSTSKEMYFYGMVLSPIEPGCWIGMFVNDGTTADIGKLVYHYFDAIDNRTYVVRDTPPYDVIGGLPKRGMSLSEMTLKKGSDYQIRTLFHSSAASGEGVHHSSPTLKMNIDCVFYTIYPFSTS